jgi:hypothetical protein
MPTCILPTAEVWIICILLKTFNLHCFPALASYALLKFKLVLQAVLSLFPKWKQPVFVTSCTGSVVQ